MASPLSPQVPQFPALPVSAAPVVPSDGRRIGVRSVLGYSEGVWDSPRGAARAPSLCLVSRSAGGYPHVFRYAQNARLARLARRGRAHRPA
ncbi:hypothetical protein DA2_2691 [Desulfovibrio sp. A2]|nr:hypothetical protein DA2_2691 [Desulfovibrio sp. A2]